MVSDPGTLQDLVNAAIAALSILGGFMAFTSGLLAAVGLVTGQSDSWITRQFNHAIGAGFIIGLLPAAGAGMIGLVL
jgi:hypothetical protein